MKQRTLKLLALLILMGSLPGMTLWNASDTKPEEQPLLPMMQKLMVQMNRINTGIYMQDYRVIDTTAHNIAHHPKIASSQMKKIKEALGPEIKKFVYYDLKMVHSHADSMSMAARRKNMQQVLKHYEIVQRGCVNCHINFRDKLRDVLHPDRDKSDTD